MQQKGPIVSSSKLKIIDEVDTMILIIGIYNWIIILAIGGDKAPLK